jgi:hypothetical protein
LSTQLLALITVGLLRKLKKLPEPVIVVAAAVIGLLVHPGAKVWRYQRDSRRGCRGSILLRVDGLTQY